ncbi:MAG TPA: GNAT family N-acetyltransferase [Actinomycetota bacterium]|nr:GNAT family N-acetyltransferase [Actinomycetota bacterium]
MNTITVRMAAPSDWAAVAGLLVELGRGVAAGTADDPTHQLQFAGHIRRIDNVTLVAESDGDAIGVIDMEYHQRLGDHRPQARVNDLVVADRARGAGAGRALLTRAEELARKRGCFRMALVTAAWREDTIAFYERQGWQNYGQWFVKSLTDEVSPGGEPIRDDN